MPSRTALHRLVIPVLAFAAATTWTSAASSPASAQPYTVSAPTSYPAGAGPRGVISWDFNGDGRADLATVNYTASSVSVLLSSASGGFLPKVDYPLAAGAGPLTISVGDLNGDFRADLLIANYLTGRVSVMLGNPDGTFGPRTDHISGTKTASVEAAHFPNGYGFVAANFGVNNVSVFIGGVKTNFTVGEGPNWVRAMDLNADGIVDIVTANFTANTVSVLIGNSNGTYQPHVQYAVGSGPVTLALGDVNGDGRPDLATSNYLGNTVSVLLGQGNGTFASRVDLPAAASPYRVLMCDVNVDGKRDLVTANNASNSVSVYIGNGAGDFAPKVDYAVGAWPLDVAVADMNGDGRQDIVSADHSASTVSLLAGTSGGFRVGQSISAFTAKDQSQTARSLSDYLGKWVVLDFCSSWCGPCYLQAKEVMTVYDTWAAAGTISFEYLTGLVDGPQWNKGSTASDAVAWASRGGITRPVFHDGGLGWGPNRAFMEALGRNAYPTVAIIDPSGTIRFLQAGVLSARALVDTVAALAGVPSPPLVVHSPPQVAGPPVSGLMKASYDGIVLSSEFDPPAYPRSFPFSTTGFGDGAYGTLDVTEISPYGNESWALSFTYDNYIENPNWWPPLPTAQPWVLELDSLTYATQVSRSLAPPGTAPVTVVDTLGSEIPTSLTVDLTYSNGRLQVSPIALAGIPGLPPVRTIKVGPFVMNRYFPGVTAVPPPPTGAVALLAPRPDPATSTSRLAWTQSRAGHSRLEVWDLAGRRVRTLVDGERPAGLHESDWDLADASGARVQAGLYFVRLTVPGQGASLARMTVLR